MKYLKGEYDLVVNYIIQDNIMNEYQHQDLVNQIPGPTVSTPSPMTANNAISLPGTPVLITGRMKLAFILALFLSLLIANLVFLNGFALGFSITVIMTQAAIFLVLPRPASTKVFSSCVLFGAIIIALGMTFFFYSDGMLAFLDFNVLMLLFFLQALLYSETLPVDWDNPVFYLELLISPFVRPFICISSLFKVAKGFSSKKSGQADPSVLKRRAVIGKVLLGLLISLPAMAIAILLLSSADPVFKTIFQSLMDFISKATAQEILSTLLLTLFCFPFIFSLISSYLTKWKANAISSVPAITGKPRFHLDSVIVATFLTCVNMIYAIFTVVQFSTLFGAFSMSLPDNLTYAEYARQGFFQLAAIAAINLVFVVLSVLFTQRHSFSGMVVRILSVFLVFFTFVQLASAGYRMKMYIDAFSLSKLRFLVCVFMGLIAFLLIFAFIKEFLPKFRFFKTCMITALLVLVFTNYVNPNAQIARYNTARYLEDDISIGSSSPDVEEEIDSEYLVYELSCDAIPYLIPLLDAKDKNVTTIVKYSLLELYEYQLKDYNNGDWRRLILSKENAKKAIEAYFGNNLAKELESVHSDGYYKNTAD